MNHIITNIRSELLENVELKYKQGAERYFKEPVIYYGVRTATVIKIGKKYWKEIRTWPKEKIFEISEKLLKSDYSEEAYIVSEWGRNFNRFTSVDNLKIFEKWIDKYLNSWAKIDSFCNHTMGDFFTKFPTKTSILIKWTKSKNRWVRRASAVSLIVPASKGKFLDLVFNICNILLLDKDDLVQKGYGWLLKVSSQTHQKQVFDYVMKNKKTMPRTALRYAIEKMPQNLRQKAML